MAKIVITYGVPQAGFAPLQGHEVHIPPEGEEFSHEELLSLIRDADAAVACKAFGKEIIDAAQSLKLIVCYGAGYDAIDIKAATAKGIPVVNTPQAVTEPTAELTIAHILNLARRLTEFDHLVRTLPASELFVLGKRMGTSLGDAVLGIVGMGRIGGRVADFGRLMGMEILYTARSPKPEQDALGARHVALDALMKESDFVCIHCPHTPETTGLISREMLSLMKPTAFLINTARGPIVDEEALIEALRNHRIAGAGLDVYTNEPHVNPAFFELDNVCLTPHVGANTHRARYQKAKIASEQILRVLNGKELQNLVNPDALKH